MGKMKIGIYCYIIADILTNFFLEMFVEWSFTKHIFFPNGCHGNQKAQLWKFKTRGPLVLYRSPECWGYVKISAYWEV